jgi:hypothetical protein
MTEIFGTFAGNEKILKNPGPETREGSLVKD